MNSNNTTIDSSSVSDDNEYPNFCDQASKDDNIFKLFKSNPKYTPILEHVTEQLGKQYLTIINRDNPTLLDNIDKYKTNDTVGTPIKHQFDIGLLSPTTLRYIKVVSDLKLLFGNLAGKDIVEIGCGYGGQAKIIMDTYDINSYTLIDLKPVLNLTKKYLESFELDTKKILYKTIDELGDTNYDLAISNYAYTECTKDIQLEYYNKVLSKSKTGYITANFINDIFDLEYLTRDELMKMFDNPTALPEEPNTNPKNFILTWK